MPCHCCESNIASEYLSSSASRSSGDNDWPIFRFRVFLGARSGRSVLFVFFSPMKYCKTNHILIDNHGIHVLLFQASAVAHDIRKKKMLASGPTRFQPYILICPWPHFERYVTQTLPRNEQKNETKNTNYLEVLTHLLRTEL